MFALNAAEYFIESSRKIEGEPIYEELKERFDSLLKTVFSEYKDSLEVDCRARASANILK